MVRSSLCLIAFLPALLAPVFGQECSVPPPIADLHSSDRNEKFRALLERREHGAAPAAVAAVVELPGRQRSGESRVAHAQAPLLRHFQEQSQIVSGVPYRVLRMDIDITRDGVPELLLAKALPDGRSGEQEWFVYSRVGGARYRLLGTLDFSFLLFRLTDDSTLVVYDPGLSAMVSYRVDADGFREESRRSSVAPGGDDWAAFASWRKAVNLKVLAAAVQDLERSSRPTWTDLLINQVVTGVGSLAGLVVVK